MISLSHIGLNQGLNQVQHGLRCDRQNIILFKMFRMRFAATLIRHFNKIIYIAMVAMSLTSTLRAISVYPYNICTCKYEYMYMSNTIKKMIILNNIGL